MLVLTGTGPDIVIVSTDAIIYSQLIGPHDRANPLFHRRQTNPADLLPVPRVQCQPRPHERQGVMSSHHHRSLLSGKGRENESVMNVMTTEWIVQIEQIGVTGTTSLIAKTGEVDNSVVMAIPREQ